MVRSRSGQRHSPGTCVREKTQLVPFVSWRLSVLPAGRDPQLALKTERRGKLPVTQVLRCLTAIRCAAFATCFVHPSPVTSLPELFPTGRAGPEAPLRCGTARLFCRVMGMWCRPLFWWIEGRAGGRGSGAALGACGASGRRVLPRPCSGSLCGCWSCHHSPRLLPSLESFSFL